MNDYCERFRFALDMNADMVFTISDVWLMFKFIWLLPAKAVVGCVHEIPRLAAFFEINCQTGESWGGGVFSFFGWNVVVLIVWMIVWTIDHLGAIQKAKQNAVLRKTLGYDD